MEINIEQEGKATQEEGTIIPRSKSTSVERKREEGVDYPQTYESAHLQTRKLIHTGEKLTCIHRYER